MPWKQIAQELNDQIYFLTFTVNHWYYIFDRYNRWEIIENSLNYCIKNKGLKIYAYVFMLNHIHLIVEAPDVSGFVRDFKKYTAGEIIDNLRKNEPLVAKLFEDKDGKYSIWKKTNMPILLESESVFWQKKAYVEANPVKKSYVNDSSHWIRSSANPKSKIQCSVL